ncbi:Nuclear Pore-Associated Protein 1 [Manis pentadactyla]|nr:Nuclear Pore-Associated Protein 1 [Manis pentadactyla]
MFYLLGGLIQKQQCPLTPAHTVPGCQSRPQRKGRVKTTRRLTAAWEGDAGHEARRHAIQELPAGTCQQQAPQEDSIRASGYPLPQPRPLPAPRDRGELSPPPKCPCLAVAKNLGHLENKPDRHRDRRLGGKTEDMAAGSAPQPAPSSFPPAPETAGCPPLTTDTSEVPAVGIPPKEKKGLCHSFPATAWLTSNFPAAPSTSTTSFQQPSCPVNSPSPVGTDSPAPCFLPTPVPVPSLNNSDIVIGSITSTSGRPTMAAQAPAGLSSPPNSHPEVGMDMTPLSYAVIFHLAPVSGTNHFPASVVPPPNKPGSGRIVSARVSTSVPSKVAGIKNAVNTHVSNAIKPVPSTSWKALYGHSSYKICKKSSKKRAGGTRISYNQLIEAMRGHGMAAQGQQGNTFMAAPAAPRIISHSRFTLGKNLVPAAVTVFPD